MIIEKVNIVFFSATGTTVKIVSAVGSGLGINNSHTIDLITSGQDSIVIPNDEIVIFGVPVFSGRVPEVARRAIEKISGNNTPAIVVCVYGNREFDDALLELKEVVEKGGFNVISAGAFIAQHSIFPAVAHGRPDENDLKLAREFGVKSIQNIENRSLVVKGNNPYREPKSIPLTPKTDSSCNSCKLCAKQCPVQAIDMNNPKKIDKSRCISCAHCISICPKHSKKFGGLIYWLASKKFTKNFSQRKEPYLIYP